jgi:hypothetical protein
MKTIIAMLAILTFTPAALSQQNQSADDHHASMNNRGDHAMGFSHEETTHHFRLFKDGGAIEVLANDPKDTGSRDMIRMHLAHIAKMFANGDFDAPMFIHATDPPGVPTMIELRNQIHYQFEKIDSGGKVTIQTEDIKALAAIHDFLRFQISEHETGDPTTVPGGDSKSQ